MSIWNGWPALQENAHAWNGLLSHRASIVVRLPVTCWFAPIVPITPVGLAIATGAPPIGMMPRVNMP